MKKLKTLSLTALFLLVVTGSAMAETILLNIYTYVNKVCQITTAPSAVTFTFDPSVSSSYVMESSLQFWCTNGVNFNVTVSKGLYPDASGNPRLKHNSSDYYIPYRLTYTPASGTGQGVLTPQTITVTAEVSPNDVSSAPLGTYSDTITVTIQPL